MFSFRQFGIATLVAYTLIMASCGASVQDAPGSWGAEDTNLILRASLIPESSGVDVCNCASSSTLMADFDVEAINSSLPENTLHLQYYSVTITASTAGAPSIAQATYMQSIDLPATTQAVQLMSAEAKAAYLDGITAPSYSGPAEATYSVQYVFYAVDDYGASAGATAYATVTLARGSDCAPPAITPVSISVTGIANPDADTADDIDFVLSGGTEPYKVYSDNEAVISAPGDIAPGAGGFSIDPDAVIANTDVTLTVVDAFGLSATALVKVTP